MTETIHFRVDPLSRRSLLVHPAQATLSKRFILSSTRCAFARASQIEMQALEGGEGGTIHLRDIKIIDGVGQSAKHPRLTQGAIGDVSGSKNNCVEWAESMGKYWRIVGPTS